ncbi:hypothetical protein PENTCL1PPCAC_4541, partial [Pristionchus entomophagus]
VLIKYQGYPVPSWISLSSIGKGKAQDDLAHRLALMDFVEFFLIEQIGLARFEDEYGFRYLYHEEGIGYGLYINDTWSLYTNRLRAIEHSWNTINKSWNQPRVYIEDWTGKRFDDEALRKLD